MTNSLLRCGYAGPSSSSLRGVLREKSAKRKELLKKSLGALPTDDLSALLGTAAKDVHRVVGQPTGSIVVSPPSEPGGSTKELVLVPPATVGGAAGAGSPAGSLTIPIVATPAHRSAPSEDSGGSKKAAPRLASPDSDEEGIIDDYYKVLKEEEREYRGSATFLKGTQSANPHNDYSQHFVDTGQRPQNFIRDPGLHERFDEYPKLKELIKLKDELVTSTATPPMYMRADLLRTPLADLGSRFSVILIEPPLAEYQARLPTGTGQQTWTWDMIEQLDVPSIADNRCFLWIWCGSSPEGTARGRQCLRRWGFRRCEDICWIKRNEKSGKRGQLDPESLFHRTKEHCLMGITGTVRRSVDGDFIHANVDIDLIITEEPTAESGVDPRTKPEEVFLLAEHFCLGRRRVHLFGRDDTLRPGWVTVGPELSSSNYDAKKYRAFFDRPPYLTTGCTERIESLRPKSPERGGPKRGPPPDGPQDKTGGPPKGGACGRGESHRGGPRRGGEGRLQQRPRQTNDRPGPPPLKRQRPGGPPRQPPAMRARRPRGSRENRGGGRRYSAIQGPRNPREDRPLRRPPTRAGQGPSHPRFRHPHQRPNLAGGPYNAARRGGYNSAARRLPRNAGGSHRRIQPPAYQRHHANRRP